MATKKEIEKLKKAVFAAEKVYLDAKNKYYEAHYSTDKEYKALCDAEHAYNNAISEYVLTKLATYPDEKNNAKKRLIAWQNKTK